jgi:hypothetical protein
MIHATTNGHIGAPERSIFPPLALTRGRSEMQNGSAVGSRRERKK